MGDEVMHRTIKSDDIIDYFTGAKSADFKLSKNEDIEYRGGRLYHSSGNTDIKIKGKSKLKSSGEQKSFSDAFSVHGSYSLNLEHCYAQPKTTLDRQRRSLSAAMDDDMTEEGLKASYNKSE